jgi:hypothetical protein
MPTTSMLKVGLFLQKHCQQEELNLRTTQLFQTIQGSKMGIHCCYNPKKPHQLCFALLCLEVAYNSPKSPPTHQNLFQLFNTCIWQAPKTSSSHHQQQLRERLAHAAHILRSLRKTHSLY